MSDPSYPRRGKRANSSGLSEVGEAAWLTTFGFVGGFLLTASIGIAILAIGLGGSSSSAASPNDAVSLLTGQRLYATSCASCHGTNGEGRVGPALGDGAVVENYPDIADQIRVIAAGRNAMPSFEGQLTPEEIESVALYERDELGR